MRAQVNRHARRQACRTHMSKRAPQFERHERDLYVTPPEAVLPLKRFIRPGSTFYEPCAADGGLAWAIERKLGLVFLGMSDIEPLSTAVRKENVFDFTATHGAAVD